MTTIKDIEREFKLKFKISLYSFNHNAYSLNWIIERAKLQTKKEDLEIIKSFKGFRISKFESGVRHTMISKEELIERFEGKQEDGE